VRISLTPTALAKAKALGVVAAALSAGGAGGAVALSQVANTSTTAVAVAADATATPEATVTPSETPTGTPTESATEEAAGPAASPTSTAYVLPSCPADVKNHGAYVSSVAKSAPKGAGGEHGTWVSQAANSDCGKPSPGASESADAQDSPETEVQGSKSPKPAKTAGHHSRSSKRHGHGHSS
jgi:hypothetical protein